MRWGRSEWGHRGHGRDSSETECRTGDLHRCNVIGSEANGQLLTAVSVKGSVAARQSRRKPVLPMRGCETGIGRAGWRGTGGVVPATNLVSTGGGGIPGARGT